MCGRYARQLEFEFGVDQREALEDLNPLLADQLMQREPAYNIHPTQIQPVIVRSDGDVELKGMRWGLVPSWAKDKKIGARAINARRETVREKPMFRAAWKKSRRLLIVATGFFEWTGEPGSKQPWFVYPPNHSLLLFAGLWEAWKDPTDPCGGWTRSFAIITGEPGKVRGDVHDRQPVILPPSMWEPWLTGTPEEGAHLLGDVPAVNLVYHPVTKALNSPKSQGAHLVEPIEL